MCTVSFIPFSSGFLVTHNRDEAINRPALFPASYREMDTVLYYPKDLRKGGTWIGVAQAKKMVSLMNGAFQRHKREKEYRKSRGIVVKELLAAKQDLLTTFESMNLTGIEAFFAIGLEWKNGINLYEMIWDGEKRYWQQRETDKPLIWSSAMLYSKEDSTRKENHFTQFIHRYVERDMKADEVWDFHRIQKWEDGEGMCINRGFLKTTSIAQLFSHKDQLTFRYEDLLLHKEQKEVLDF